VSKPSQKSPVPGRMAGKVAVITGAASGIGEATARLFAREGASLVLADVQTDKGNALAQALGNSIFVHTDVTREDAVAALVDRAAGHFSRIDCMINNAGAVGATGSIAQISLEAYQSTIAILQTSVFLGIKHAARIMIGQKSGCILNTTSTAGIAALGPHIYTAAKHAVVGLTRSAANELAPYHIRVNAIGPGSTPTSLLGKVYGSIERAREAVTKVSPLGYPVEVEDVAAGFLFLASDEGRAITGQILMIDAGVTTCTVAPKMYSGEPDFLR